MLFRVKRAHSGTGTVADSLTDIFASHGGQGSLMSQLLPTKSLIVLPQK